MAVVCRDQFHGNGNRSFDLGGAWLGEKLDTVWGTRPYLLMAGVLLGLGVGFSVPFTP